MKRIFAPGCALVLYKPQLAERLSIYLSEQHGSNGQLRTCCRHAPRVPMGTQVINVCPGCDQRFRRGVENPMTVSLWEILAGSDSFPFPDHGGRRMTIIDACPTRDQDRIHQSVRMLAAKMNITIVEPARTRRKSTCCGDVFYGKLPTEQVVERMKIKARELPLQEVLVYCVSCCKSMFNGEKQPRYLIDLLFSEDTIADSCYPDDWHRELDAHMENHKNYLVLTEAGSCHHDSTNFPVRPPIP